MGILKADESDWKLTQRETFNAHFLCARGFLCIISQNPQSPIQVLSLAHDPQMEGWSLGALTSQSWHSLPGTQAGLAHRAGSLNSCTTFM